MPREYSRKLRVAAELQRLINELLRAEVKDPRLDGVTVNDVEVSGDLGVAKFYYGTLDPDAEEEQAQEAFERASGFLRSRIGRSLQLRRVPELHFVRDTSARRGFELRRLIDELNVSAAQPQSEVEPDADTGDVDDFDSGGSARDFDDTDPADVIDVDGDDVDPGDSTDPDDAGRAKG